MSIKTYVSRDPNIWRTDKDNAGIFQGWYKSDSQTQTYITILPIGNYNPSQIQLKSLTVTLNITGGDGQRWICVAKPPSTAPFIFNENSLPEVYVPIIADTRYGDDGPYIDKDNLIYTKTITSDGNYSLNITIPNGYAYNYIIFCSGEPKPSNDDAWSWNYFSGTVTEIIKPILTVTYNKNGGSQGTPNDDKLIMSNGKYTHTRSFGEEYNSKAGLYNIGSFALTKTGYHADSWLYGNKEILQDQSWDNGWNTEDLAKYCGKELNIGDQSIELLANWKENQYTINFNGNGATSGSMDEQLFQYDIAQYLTPNAFQKIGYTFTHWNTKSDNSGTSYSNQANVKNLSTNNGAVINLYAQWSPNTYTISLDHNGGNSTISRIYEKYDTCWSLASSCDTSISHLPDIPVRPGYKFLGYYDENDKQVIKEDGGIIVFTDHFSKHTTITAKWKLNGFVYICTDPNSNKWEKAIPYIYTKNLDETFEWKPATPYIYTDSKWTICGD